MMPTEVAGSRLPVGSSASRISGRFTKARAIDTRCCSPPDSSFGQFSVFLASPTSSRMAGTCVLMTCSRPPDHLEGEGHVLVDGLVRQQLEVLEDAADVAAQVRAPSSWSARRCPCRRRRSGRRSGVSSLLSRRMSVDLPEPDGPDEEDELALLDVGAGIAEGDDVALVDLGHVFELDHEGRAACRERRGSGPNRWLERRACSAASHVSIGCLIRAAPPSAKGDEMDPAPVTIARAVAGPSTPRHRSRTRWCGRSEPCSDTPFSAVAGSWA